MPVSAIGNGNRMETVYNGSCLIFTTENVRFTAFQYRNFSGISI